jgi:hypothetical protein
LIAFGDNFRPLPDLRSGCVNTAETETDEQPSCKKFKTGNAISSEPRNARLNILVVILKFSLRDFKIIGQ